MKIHTITLAHNFNKSFKSSDNAANKQNNPIIPSNNNLQDKLNVYPKRNDLYVENGKVYNGNKSPYYGLITHTDKNNNRWIFSYKNGNLIKSEKEFKPYKQYTYDNTRKSILKQGDIPYLFMKKTLSDNEEISEFNAFPFSNIETMIVEDSNGGKTAIIKNKDPMYRLEPVYITSSSNGNTLIVESETGEENVYFHNTDEAKKYFNDEYGIEIDNISLKQAYVLKQAVDSFTKLNYRNKGKKLFEGLKITGEYIGKNKDNKYITASTNTSYKEINLEGKKYDNFVELINDIPEEKFVLKEPPNITLNRNIDSEAEEEIIKYGYLTGEFAFSSLLSLFQHELGHYLHITENPKIYFVSSKIPGSLVLLDTLPAALEVSEYSVKHNLNEYVAEYIAGKMNNAQYSEAADNLYKKLKGPDLFSNKQN